MKRKQNTPILIATSVLFFSVWCTTGTFASVTLTNIPIAAWQTNSSGVLNTNNEGRAISPDGKYVVGYSYSANNLGYFYDVANNIVRQPNGGGAVPNTPVTGIAYRTDTNQIPPQDQLVLDGMSSGFQTDWMTADGGVTWGAKRRNTSFAPATQSTVNTLGAVLGSDAYYQTIRGSSDTQVYVNQGSGTWPGNFYYEVKGIGSGDTAAMNGVAGTGRAVGWRKTGGVKFNYVLDWNGVLAPATGTPTPWNFAGLFGDNSGEAFSVSADGLVVFGQSLPGDYPTRAGLWPYKATFDATMPGPATQLSTNELPSFPDTAGSSSLGVPYGCTADGKYAVGMSYRGTERAALWDTSDPDPTKWKATDLTDLASANGVLGIFTRLYRGYSVGTNAAGDPVITGNGVASDLAIRGFVITVPKAIAAAGFWLPPKPRLTISGSYPAGFTLSYPSTLGTTNYTEYTANLAPPSTWTPISTNDGTGSTITVFDATPGNPQRFYRVRVTH
jgi:hypothetical protein